MKLKAFRCPECNAVARGTVDTVPGIAEMTISRAGVATYSGETDMDWDSQKTNTNAAGEVELICPNDHRWFSATEEKRKR